MGYGTLKRVQGDILRLLGQPLCPYFFYGSFFNSKDALRLEDKTQKDNKAKSYNEYP